MLLKGDYSMSNGKLHIIGKRVRLTKDKPIFEPFFNESVLEAIVKVGDTEIITDHENNILNTQIIIKCKALDSLGFVFSIDLYFLPKTVVKRNRILSDLKKNSIFMVKGSYNIWQDELLMGMSDPKYSPLPRSLNEKEIRKVFRVNSSPSMKL